MTMTLGVEEIQHQGNYLQHNEQLLLNPNCTARNFLDYVIDKCGFSPDLNLEFCDEHGNLAYVAEKGPMENLASSMIPRTTYIPLHMHRDPNKKTMKLTPLLTGFEKLFPGLEQKLKSYMTGSGDKQRKRSPLGEKLNKRMHAEKSRTTFRQEKDNIDVGGSVLAVKRSASRMLTKTRGKKKGGD